MTHEITREKIDKYFEVGRRALEKAKVGVPERTHMYDVAKDFYDMAERYIQDAQHYFEKEDWVTAFASLNYAHGWLDAGARLGLFDVKHDSVLFTVD